MSLPVSSGPHLVVANRFRPHSPRGRRGKSLGVTRTPSSLERGSSSEDHARVSGEACGHLTHDEG